MGFISITDKNRKWWVFSAMTTTMSMVFIDITVLPVALPTIQRELGASNLGLQWIVNAYTFVLAVLVLGSGRLADIWGLKRAFCFGNLLFAVSSLLCGLSRSEGFLIAFRALQGLGGAFLLPATPAIIYSTFPPQQRGKISGLMVSISSIFLSIGPLLGGSLTEYLSWQFIFWINLPIAITGLVLAIISVPKEKKLEESFDFAGFLTLAMGIGVIIIALMQAQTWGFTSPLTLLLFALGIIFPYLFFKIERNIAHPIIDLGLISKKFFWAGCSAIFCVQTLTMITIFWAIYFQVILDFSPVNAGVYAFIANAPVLFGAPLGDYLVDKFGPRLPIMLGFVLILVALTLFISTTPQKSIFLLLLALIPFSFGIPMIYSPSYISILNEVSAKERGLTSGITSSLRQFSSTFGLAIFGTIFTHVQSLHLSKLLLTNEKTREIHPNNLEGVLAKAPLALKTLSSLSQEEVKFIISIAKNSFISALNTINIGASFFALLGLLIAYRHIKNHPLHKS